jgi:diacylglycerol kinase (ATP)
VIPDIVIITNPASGSRRGPGLAADVLKILQRGGVRVNILNTSAAGEAHHLAAAAVAQGVPVVAGCGGDGTLQEIAAALQEKPTALGLLPCGRCNDFARALGITRNQTPEAMARALIAGTKKTVDLGAMGERRFLTVATLGFDSEVSRFVETRRLWVKGTAAYLYGVFRILLSFRAPQVRLRGDFGLIEGRVLLAATGNTPCYGGAMRITPGALMDDGKFHLCVVENVPRGTVLAMLPRVIKGSHIHHPAVRMLETRTLEIETPERPHWICADGETLGQTPAKFEIRPGVLQVMSPYSAP